MSLIDVLGPDGQPTGVKKTKPEIHEHGFWHSAAHIWIYNSKGEMLLQLRAKDKDSHPGLFDIGAAGHIDAGESPIEAALREAKEELGLKLTKKDLKEIGTRRVSKTFEEIGWQNNEIDHVYLYKFDGDISGLAFPDREVESLIWIKLDVLEGELSDPEKSKKYVDHDDYYGFAMEAIRKELRK